MIERNLQTFQDMRTFFCLIEVELRTATHDFLTMFNELRQNLLETHHLWLNTVNQRQDIIVERSL